MKFFPLVMLISEYITPVMYIDPSGESFILIILTTISIAMLVSAGIITATEIYLNKKSMNEIPELILPANIDVNNEVMLKAYFDQQVRNYLEQRYINSLAMMNLKVLVLSLLVSVNIKNIPFKMIAFDKASQ